MELIEINARDINLACNKLSYYYYYFYYYYYSTILIVSDINAVLYRSLHAHTRQSQRASYSLVRAPDQEDMSLNSWGLLGATKAVSETRDR
jgi:hypothetical protein